MHVVLKLPWVSSAYQLLPGLRGSPFFSRVSAPALGLVQSRAVVIAPSEGRESSTKLQDVRYTEEW